ncbi:MAG: hypothetical protein WCO56_11500 [Verrucomicrobiota bacterium]
MDQFNINAGGQNISLQLDSRLYDPKNRNILGPYDYFETGNGSDINLTLLYGRRRRAFADEDFLNIRHYRGKAGSHIIRQLACYLAAFHTRKFDLVHGTGLLVNPESRKGVLLIGPGHCGKSTLSRELGEIIMDDDIMLINEDTMQVAGKMGFVTYKHPVHGRKFLTPLPSGEKEARLTMVFILDKKEQGGKYADVDNRIPRRFAVPEDLPPLLKKAYLKLNPIKVDAPIFRLGTRGRLPQTVEVLRHLIDQHI